MGTHPFPYRLIRSNRKTLAIQVSASGQVTVRAPRTMSDTTIENFLTQKEQESQPSCAKRLAFEIFLATLLDSNATC